jgi:hypothetical protein
MCFVGFDSKHSLFNVGFHKTKVAAIYRYRNINNLTTNKIWSQLNWLGCAEHPFSEENTLELLKKIADDIAGVKEKPKEPSKDNDDFDETLVKILDMVCLI